MFEEASPSIVYLGYILTVEDIVFCIWIPLVLLYGLLNVEMVQFPNPLSIFELDGKLTVSG